MLSDQLLLTSCQGEQILTVRVKCYGSGESLMLSTDNIAPLGTRVKAHVSPLSCSVVHITTGTS